MSHPNVIVITDPREHDLITALLELAERDRETYEALRASMWSAIAQADGRAGEGAELRHEWLGANAEQAAQPTYVYPCFAAVRS